MPAHPEQPWTATESPRGAGPGGPRPPSDLEGLLAREDLQVIPLQKNAHALLEFLPAIGPLAAITRNPAATCACWGPAGTVTGLPEAWLIGAGARNLCLLGQGWRHSAVVLNRLDPGCPPSLLLFGEYGELAHQLSVTAASRIEGLQALVAQHAGCRNCLKHPQAPGPPAAALACSGGLLRQAWAEAHSQGDLEARLGGLGVSRFLATRAMEGLYAAPVELAAFGCLIDEIASLGLPVHFEIGNPYCLQALECQIQEVCRATPRWVLRAPEVQIHLNTEAVHSVWSVVHPFPTGERQRLECFGADGTLVAALASPLEPEAASGRWRAVLARQGLFGP